MNETYIYTVIGIYCAISMILSFCIGIIYQTNKNKGLDSSTLYYINSLKEINGFLQAKVNRYENLYTNLSDKIADLMLSEKIALDKNC